MSQTIRDPVEAVCNIGLARSIVLGDRMYVDGGQIIDKTEYDKIDEPIPNGSIQRWQSESLLNQYLI